MNLKKNFAAALIFLTLFFTGGFSFARAVPDDSIFIWQNVPQMKREKSSLLFFKPRGKKTRAAIIVCPGGSYHHLGLYGEGFCSARWLSENGIAAFVLKYRTAQDGYSHPAMLQDVQRAIQIVRENADFYEIDADKVGVLGYSAGGHLAVMSAEFFEKSELEKIGVSSKASLKPNFVISVYPVVSMQDDIAHSWSRKSLLGKKPSQKQKDDFSLEMNVFSEMPPVYVVVAKDDAVVKWTNSQRLFSALTEKNVKGCEIEIYDWGGHGFGMQNNAFMREFHWNQKILAWLKKIKILE